MFKKYYEKFKILISPLNTAKKYLFSLLVMNLYLGIYGIFIIYNSSKIINSIENKDYINFKFWIIVLIISTIIKIIFMYLNDPIYPLFNAKIKAYLIQKYYVKYINIDNNKAETIGTGKNNSIIGTGISTWNNILVEFLNLFITIIEIIYVFILVSINAPNILYLLGFIFTFFLIIFIFWKGVNVVAGIRKEVKELSILKDAKSVKIFMSKFEVLQNNKSQKEVNDIINLELEIGNKWRKGNLKKGLIQLPAFLTLDGLYIIIFSIVGYGIITGNYKIAYLTLLIWLTQNLSKLAWGLRTNIREIIDGMIHIDKLIETFDNITEIPGINNPIAFKYIKGDMKIDNLTYGYNDDNVFNNFSLKINGGKKTALVGDSGSGKTTLMKLIAGYIHPKSGDIIVDNQNIADINLISYYKNIGYLTQEPSVFDGTIIENLTYALDREPTKQELEETIKNSKCDFIYELANGLETEIGERGVKLSGGQKQRLAIAKIMLKNPNIILLDEPTSALDSISEQIVSEAFHNLFKGRTVIVIAHRLQTVKEADEILVFKKGEIIERGNHEELSKKENGEYKKMLDLQTSF